MRNRVPDEAWQAYDEGVSHAQAVETLNQQAQTFKVANSFLGAILLGDGVTRMVHSVKHGKLVQKDANQPPERKVSVLGLIVGIAETGVGAYAMKDMVKDLCKAAMKGRG